MTRDRHYLLIVILYSVTLFAIAYGLGSRSATLNMMTAIPQCPEDSTLVGYGDYSGGHFEAYQCGPAVDDFEAVK